jgi:hypothetical protein
MFIMAVTTRRLHLSRSGPKIIAYIQMRTYQAHIKSEIPKLRGKGMSAQQTSCQQI